MVPRSLTTFVVALILTFAVVAVAFSVTSGNARADLGITPPFGFETRDGLFVIPYYQALLGVNSITPGTLVFSDLIYLEIYDLSGNRTAKISVEQMASPPVWYNQTYGLTTGVNVLSFTIPSEEQYVSAELCVDGGCVGFGHETPITLFPSGIISIGGVDLIAFALTAEFAVLVIPLTVLSKALTRKAVWSPSGLMPALVAPHLVLLFASLIVFDYPLFDHLFSGLEFILIPICFALVFFFWSLHLFNNATPLESFKIDPRRRHNVGVYRWRVFIGELPDGRLALIGTAWRDWIARLRGHAPIIWDPTVTGSANPPPAFAPVVTLKSELRGERSDRRVRVWEKRYRGKPGHENPLKQFEVINAASSRISPREKDAPRLLGFVDHDRWLQAEMPYVSWHRPQPVQTKYNADGSIKEEAYTKQKWTWPHYVDPPAKISLADVHWFDTVAAGLGFISAERQARRNEELRASNIALRATPFVTGDEQASSQTDELFTLLERERFGMSDAEADEETRREASKTAKPATTLEEAETRQLRPEPRRRREPEAGS